MAGSCEETDLPLLVADGWPFLEALGLENLGLKYCKVAVAMRLNYSPAAQSTQILHGNNLEPELLLPR
jgi:hypothetical protein